MDGSRSMKFGHSSWLELSRTQEPTSSSRMILQNAQVADLPPADSSCIKQGPYSNGVYNQYHHHPPSTSCAYYHHQYDFSWPTDSPIRPDTTEAEIGGRYRQQGSQQGFNPPPMFQARSPSADLQHAGKKSSPPPPRHAIRLMGVLMSPEVAPATFTSQNTAEETTVAPLEDYSLRSLQKETDKISLPGFHDRDGPAIILSQDHAGTGDVAAKTISSGVISGRQAQSPEMTGSWEPLKFDASVFQSSVADPDRQKITQIVDLIYQLNKGEPGGQLQMTTIQFRQFHGKVFRNDFHPAGRDTTSKIDPNSSLRKRLAASKSLYESRRSWYRRWATMLHDPQRLTDLTLQQQDDTLNETLALMFLFFVEMITSIVTSPYKAENNVKEQLDKALGILEDLFDTSSSSSSLSARFSHDQASNLDHESAPLHPHTNSALHETDILIKMHETKFGLYPALWSLLQRWMYTYRNRFAKKIIPGNKDILQVKVFFNTIFYLSIRNLNDRHM